MRLIFFLFLAVSIMFLVALFPEVARQEMHVEAFNWVFSAKQGSLMIVMFLLLCLVWALRRLMRLAFGIPSRFGGWWRLGGERQQEARVRAMIAYRLNEQTEVAPKALKKSQSLMPAWGAQLLKQWLEPVEVGEDDDPLNIAMAARQATEADSGVNLLSRKKLLAAWLKAYPKSPLARKRQCELLQEEGEWLRLVHLLEDRWKKEKPAALCVKNALMHAYVKCVYTLDLASDDALTMARKACRLDADDMDAVIALGKVYQQRNDMDDANKLWMKYLEKQSCFVVADLLYLELVDDALKAYRKLEKKHAEDLNSASQWLRAKLAHASELDGLAEEHLQALLISCPCELSWRTRADWYAQKRMWQKSTEAYQEALVCREAKYDLANCR
ncbi:MAG: hypothetical protein Q9M28_00075 [Mariprofundaceae bacterium]|nr:hypothetical protein [Mariprofundaceae bacterium]